MKCELCKNPDGKKIIMKINRGNRIMEIEFIQCDVCFNKIKEKIKIK